MAHRVAVLWDRQIGGDGEVPFAGEDRDYINANFARFAQVARERDVELLHADFSDLDPARAALDRAWVHDGEWETRGNVDIDAVFDKYKYREDTRARKWAVHEHLPVVNHPRLEEICKDKWLTYGFFEDEAPETRIATRRNIERVVRKEGRAVLKPRYMLGGDGVQVVEAVAEVEEPGDPHVWVVQAFVDSSAGVPGTGIDGVHDLRAVLVNGEVQEVYARQPGEGYISNVGQGGERTDLRPGEYPEAARPVLDAAREVFADYRPNVYSVDVMFDPDGVPALVELNSPPAIGTELPGADEENEMRAVRAVVDVLADL